MSPFPDPLIGETTLGTSCAQAALCRYSDDPAERTAEIPVDEHNHAISALRYLLSKLDARGLKRKPESEPEPPPEPNPTRPWCHWLNDALYDWRYPRDQAECRTTCSLLPFPGRRTEVG